MAGKRRNIKEAAYLLWKIRRIAREAHKATPIAEFSMIAHGANLALKHLNDPKAE